MARSLSAGASVFQVLVNANAKNAMTTRWPRSADNEMSRASCDRRPKTGATSPTFRVVVCVATFVRPVGAAMRGYISRA